LVREFRQRKLGIRRAGPDRTANNIISGQRTASDAAAVSPAISAAVAATADARAAESGTAQTETAQTGTAQTGTGQTITSANTSSAPQVMRDGAAPSGYPRVRPLHQLWKNEPPQNPGDK
jgi:hypothetical protein